MDVAKFAQAVVGLSPRLLEEPARRLAAIISFAYNCGIGNYRVSTLKRKVDAADWPGAAEQIVKWDKAGGRVLAGLTRRRRSEALLLA
jgi:lysozyme